MRVRAWPLLLVLAAACAPHHGPSDEARREEKARRLLEVTSAAAVSNQVFDRVLEDLRRRGRAMPEVFADRLKQLAQEDPFIEHLVPIYVRNLDEPTLDGTIAFYTSTAGTAVAAAQPAILQEAMETGHRWGTEIAGRTLEVLQGAPAEPLSAVPFSEPAGRAAKVRELLRLTHAHELADQMLDTVLAGLGRNGRLPPGFAPTFKRIAAEDDYLGRLVPVYAAHLTDEELDAMLTFYRSDAGQSFLRAQPELLKESAEAGQAWGHELARRTLQSMGK